MCVAHLHTMFFPLKYYSFFPFELLQSHVWDQKQARQVTCFNVFFSFSDKKLMLIKKNLEQKRKGKEKKGKTKVIKETQTKRNKKRISTQGA